LFIETNPTAAQEIAMKYKIVYRLPHSRDWSMIGSFYATWTEAGMALDTIKAKNDADGKFAEYLINAAR
jgi:hypothetical protein